MAETNIDGGKIFIWAQVGETLKEIDETRILAIAHDEPEILLSNLANNEMMDIIKGMQNGVSFVETMKRIKKINYVDNKFRQVSEFLHQPPHDLLSVGSFVTGELESKTGMLDLGGDSD